MTPKSFAILVSATAIGFAGAIGAVIVESRTSAGPVEIDQPMFPELVARANDVAVLRFRTGDSESTIVRAGYPVPTDNVRTVVGGIASLRRFEEKTDQPNLYAKLGVQDVGGTDANSREVILETADGVELAAIILGRISNTMQFDPLGGMYVREPGDPRTWLVRGTVALSVITDASARAVILGAAFQNLLSAPLAHRARRHPGRTRGSPMTGMAGSCLFAIASTLRLGRRQ